MKKNKILNSLFILLAIVVFFFGGKFYDLNVYAEGNLNSVLSNNSTIGNLGNYGGENINSEPLQDLWNMLKKIKFFSFDDINVSLKPITNSSINNNLLNDLSNPQFLTDRLRELWDKTNDWFSSYVGVSLRDIIKVVVNIVIWIWELIIGLLRDLLSKI